MSTPSLDLSSQKAIAAYSRNNPSALRNELLIRISLHCQALIHTDFSVAARFLSECNQQGLLSTLLTNSLKFEQILQQPLPECHYKIFNIMSLWKAFYAPVTSDEMVGARCLNHYGCQNITEPAKLSRHGGMTLKPFSYIHSQIPNSRPVGTVGYLFVTSKQNIAKDAAGRAAIGKGDLFTQDCITQPDLSAPKKKIIVIQNTAHLVRSINDLHGNFLSQLSKSLKHNEVVLEKITLINPKSLFCQFAPLEEPYLTTVYKVLLFREFFQIYGISLPIMELSYQDNIPIVVERFDIEAKDFFTVLTERLTRENYATQLEIISSLLAGCHGTTFQDKDNKLGIRCLVPLSRKRNSFEDKVRDYLFKKHSSIYQVAMKIAQVAIDTARQVKAERKVNKTAARLENASKKVIKKHNSVAYSQAWRTGGKWTIDVKFKKKLLFGRQKSMTLDEIKRFVAKTNNINFDAVDRRDASGRTRLIQAIDESDTDTVAILLNWGADPDLSHANSDTPLIIAARLCQPKIVALLIEAGADFKKTNNKGETVFEIASKNARKMLQKRGEHNKILHSLILASDTMNAPDRQGRTFLTYAVDANNLEIVTLILQRGGDLNWRGVTPHFIKTPLIRSIQEGFFEIFELLVDCQANLFMAGVNNYTPLSTAVHAINRNQVHAYNMLSIMLSKIIKSGRVNEIDVCGMTPLLYLMRLDNEAIAFPLMEELLKAGAKRDGTALSNACAEGKVRIVALLQKYGAVAEAAHINAAHPWAARDPVKYQKIMQILNLNSAPQATPLTTTHFPKEAPYIQSVTSQIPQFDGRQVQTFSPSLPQGTSRPIEMPTPSISQEVVWGFVPPLPSSPRRSSASSELSSRPVALSSPSYGKESVTTVFKRQILFQKTKAATDLIYKVKTKVYCLVQIAKMQAANGDFMEAKATFDSAKVALDANPFQPTAKRDKALGIIARGQAAAKDINGAKATLSLIQDAAAKGFWLYKIAKTQIKNGDINGAKVSVDLIQDSTWKVNALVEIIAEVQAKNNDITGAGASLRRARELTDLIERMDYKVQFLIILAKAQTAIKDVNGANTTLAIAKETAVRMIDDAENSKTTYLFEIVKAQAANGDVNGAKATIELISKASWKDSSLVEIAKAQTANNQIPGAGITAELIQDPIWRVKAWVGIAKAQAANNNRSDSNASLTNARETAKLIDSGWKAHSLVDIAKAQAENGDITEAKATVELIIKDSINNMKIHGLIEIAKIQAANGDTNGAKKTFESARGVAELLPDEDISKGPSLVDIVRAQAWNGDIKGSMATAELLQAVDYNDEAQIIIAQAQTENKDFTGATLSLAKARAKVELLRDDDHRKVLMLVDIAKAQTANNDFGGANVSLARARAESDLHQEEDITNVLRLKIAEAQVANNDITGALATADLIREPALRVRVLVGIAKHMDDLLAVPQASTSIPSSSSFFQVNTAETRF